MARLLLLCGLLLASQDRSQVFFERIEFASVDPAGEEARRIVALLKTRDHWTAAHRAIEEGYGPFPDDLVVRVDFDYDGQELARGAGLGSRGRVRFNLKGLEAYQKRVNEIEARKKELLKQGKRLLYKVPPAKFDRIIYHELTHVLQRGYEAPDWFNEGMAQLIGDDPNCIAAFAIAGKPVDPIEARLPEINDVYARGHLFWKWLASRGASKKAVQLAVFGRKDWKETLEEVTSLSWTTIVETECEWSAAEAAKWRK